MIEGHQLLFTQREVRGENMEGVMNFLHQGAELPLPTTVQEFQLIDATLTGMIILQGDQHIQT
jgi:hypothetical protein